MAETITIQIPDEKEEREEILAFLTAKGLIQSEPMKKPGKYADLARKFREDHILTGHGEEFAKLRKGFREGFSR